MESWGRALVAGLAIAVLWSASSAARPPVRIAVLPMVVHSVESHAYLRDGLADMLTSRLARQSSVSVVRVDDPAQATTDAEQARAAGQGAGADYVLFGSFTRFGEGASLDVHCVSVSGGDPRDARSIFIQSGSLGEIIPRIDGLSERVVRHVTRPNAPVEEGPGAGLDPGGLELGSSARSELRDALSELEALRGRLDRLEEAVYGNGDSPGIAPEGTGQSLSSTAAPRP